MIAIGKRKFPDEYDISWVFHKPQDYQKRGKRKVFKGIQYAVSSYEINKNIKLNVPQIFVSNMQEFDNLETLFKSHVVFLYLHRLSSYNEIRNYQYSNCQSREEADIRIEEINSVYGDYIKNIARFDHVLLNTTHKEDLYDQVFQIISIYNN